MTLSHALDLNSNPCLEHLKQQFNAHRNRSCAGESFATLERDLHEAFAEAERACLEQLLEDYDINVETFSCNDKTYRRVSRSPGIIGTLPFY